MINKFSKRIKKGSPSELVKELLTEKGYLSGEELRIAQEKVDELENADGAKIVARAWTDPEFKQRLLEDGNSALAEMGIDAGAAKMTVVENTDKVQNVIVCTLLRTLQMFLYLRIDVEQK